MLTLDEETHTYRLDGRVLPSITQIIRALGLGHDHTNTPEFYSLRGKAVHKAIELLDTGELDDDSVDDTVRPYLERYIRFKEDTRFVPLFGELPLASRVDGFAGTIDKVGSFPKIGVGIVEFKVTESIDMLALEAQLCGQSRVWTVNKPKIRIKWKFGLQLRKCDPAVLITKFSATPDTYWLDLLKKFKEAA